MTLLGLGTVLAGIFFGLVGWTTVHIVAWVGADTIKKRAISLLRASWVAFGFGCLTAFSILQALQIDVKAGTGPSWYHIPAIFVFASCSVWTFGSGFRRELIRNRCTMDWVDGANYRWTNIGAGVGVVLFIFWWLGGF